MQYRDRVDKSFLISTLQSWSDLMDFSVSLIACGGTALTVLYLKESTRDIDLLVPKEQEYKRLIKFLGDADYRQRTGTGWIHPGQPQITFDIFRDNRVYVTDLLNSPLKPGMNIEIHRFKRIYLGTLNHYDLIITKMARGDPADVTDCMTIIESGRIDHRKLLGRYMETASYSPFASQMKTKLSYLMASMEDAGIDITEMEEDYERWQP